MAFDPHWRMTLTAILGGTGVAGPEQAQVNINLGKDTTQGVWDGQGLDPNDTVWDDMATDAQAFWADPGAGISPKARLVSVKIAPIGSDGKYLDVPAIRDFAPVAGGGEERFVPFQTALAVTLMTDGGLSRVKGRFYLPMPCFYTGENGQISEADRDGVETAAATFLSNVANQPGIDVLDIGPVVASQGRESPPAPPTNYPVTHVRVGRVIDVIRSRRSHLDELPGTATALDL